MTVAREPRAALLAVSLLLVVAGAYAQAPTADFHLDDSALILHNPVVTSLDVSAAWLGDLWSGISVPSPYYRPLVVLSFMLDRVLFGENPAGYHVHNVLWHLAAVGLLQGLCLRRLGASRALVAGLIFGLHPIQSEAVLWISARNDLMCAAGVFGGLWVADARPRAWGVLLVACVGLAALSKEVGLLFPVYLLLWRLLWRERPARSEILLAGGAAATCLAARWGMIDAVGALREPFPTHSTWEIVSHATLLTVSWLTLPWPLTSAASVFTRIASPFVLAGAVTAAIGVAWLCRAAPLRNGLLLACAVLAWVPSVVGSLNTGLVGERYLYLSVAFVAIAVAASAAGRVALLAAGAVALVWLALLGIRVAEWESGATLVAAAVARQPDAVSWAMYARQSQRDGHTREAFRGYRMATETDPPYVRECAEPVRMLLESGAYEPARRIAHDNLLPRGCDRNRDFAVERLRAEVLAGRFDQASQTLGLFSRGLRRKEYALNAAVCAEKGDLTCVASFALDEPGGAAALQVDVFDLLHPPRPPAVAVTP